MCIKKRECALNASERAFNAIECALNEDESALNEDEYAINDASECSDYYQEILKTDEIALFRST